MSSTEAHADGKPEQPYIDVNINGAEVRVLGTAHVSRVSKEAVEEELTATKYDRVAIELCPSRYQSFIDPDALTRMDIFQVIRTGKAPMVMAMLALGAFQQRIAEQFGIEPGAEMRAAIEGAKAIDANVELIDREVGTTLKRVYKNVPWWKRLYLFSGLLGSVLANEEIEEEEIERLKQGDVLENTFAQFAETATTIYEPLIAERDRYMAAKLSSLDLASGEKVLAVVGAGHLKGIGEALEGGIADPDAMIEELDQIPVRRNLWRYVPWLIVALLATGFYIGFSRSPELGWSLVTEWVVINGGLSALGAAIAGGHLITVLSAFFAAPLTSLNPTVGAGMVTGSIEAYLRRPTVGDFESLKQDTASWRGWRHNRVARTFLVFMFSTLGSAVGTYVAGFRIGSKLLG